MSAIAYHVGGRGAEMLFGNPPANGLPEDMLDEYLAALECVCKDPPGCARRIHAGVRQRLPPGRGGRWHFAI